MSLFDVEVRLGRWVAFHETRERLSLPRTPLSIRVGRYFMTTPLAAEAFRGALVNRVNGRLIGFALGWGGHRYVSVGRYRGGAS